MKHSKIMREYYQNMLDNLEPITLNTISLENGFIHTKSKWALSWDDILGSVVTAAYLLQLLIPTQWWSVGGCLPMFKIGFSF